MHFLFVMYQGSQWEGRGDRPHDRYGEGQLGQSTFPGACLLTRTILRQWSEEGRLPLRLPSDTRRTRAAVQMQT